MQGFSNRAIVVISGLLTLFVLGGTTLAVAFHHGWLRTTSGATASEVASPRAHSAVNNSAAQVADSESPSERSSDASARDDVAVYQQKLGEAYRALDDAYAQIRALQTPQARLASRGDNHERFAERDRTEERRSERRDSDDE